MHARGMAMVPAHLLRSALGVDRVLSDANVELLPTTARLRPQPPVRGGVAMATAMSACGRADGCGSVR